MDILDRLQYLGVEVRAERRYQCSASTLRQSMLYQLPL